MKEPSLLTLALPLDAGVLINAPEEIVEPDQSVAFVRTPGAETVSVAGEVTSPVAV